MLMYETPPPSIGRGDTKCWGQPSDFPRDAATASGARTDAAFQTVVIAVGRNFGQVSGASAAADSDCHVKAYAVKLCIR